MRPIHMQMAGLQSYREPQEIDFTALCDAGVFGIFGPTGSGKSTILDAMTLALFGKVERAAGGTQGIMNHAEQTLSVSFTFELGHAPKTQRFRVDRQFKRSGDVSVNSTVSRLIRYQDEETVVLADKAGEVNQRIQDILGLSMQDFTRAVVLPQGKFAEFLALKGSERRQMLQRLFHLEPYGDQLSAKTSVRFKETDIAIKELQAEQLGLGDASQQALDAAAAALEAAAAAAQEARAQLAACEARAAEQRQVRELQLALAAAQARCAEHAARAPQMQALQAQLARAAQAELAQPYARQRELTLARLAREREAAAAAEAAQRRAQEALAVAEAAHAAAREALAAQEAPLLLRLDKLQQAQALAAELARQREALGALSAREAQAAASLAAAQEQLKREQELRDKAVKRQAELKAELKQAEVPDAERERLAEALQEKRALEQWRRQLDEQRAELAKHERELAQLREEQGAAGERERQWGMQLAEWLQEVSAAYAAAKEQEQQLRRAENAIPLLLAERKAKGREAELQAMAAALTAQLVPGDPCPVCGSEHHPGTLALHEAAAGEASAASVAELERLQAEARQRQLSVSQLLLGLSGIVQQWKPLASQLQSREWLAEAAAAILSWDEAPEAETEAASGADVLELRSFEASEASEVSEEHVASAIDRAQSRIRAMNTDYQSMQRKLQELLRLRADIDRSAGEQQSRQQALHTLLAGVQHKTASLQETVSELTEQWNRKFAGIAYAEVETAAGQLKLQLAKAEDVRQRLEKSVGFIDEKLTLIGQIQEQLSGFDRQAVQLRTELKNMTQQVDEKSAKLREWAGGEDVGQQLAAAAGQLERLRAAHDQTKRSFEEAQASGQRTGQVYAAAAQAVQTATEQAAYAEEEWSRQAEAHGFASVEQVQSALLDDEVKRKWASEVEDYGKQEHQLEARRRQLTEELGGRSITDEQWNLLEEELAGRKRQDEASLQARAKAERDLESLKAKHERWNELESKRAARQSELELLGKLQSVLRGNAFVEFLAEEQLMQVSRAASERLGQLTRQKYAIEVDSSGGFIIRDDANGGVRRPVSTLSGGETFLTSLSLALALSAQIQLKGQYPLEFFFLDEGFGTLDQDLLETVIVALEKLHMDKLTVGVISHVPELRARLPRRLVVQPAEPGGKGSSVFLETL
ncbi:Nuclease SbcCD subunit C [Paenibacillus konkukensis]|uniref:Nuclease SbcCD subunit C n=2 Tax=Paenibacillus TaxID=44249 RepID=A0ABY4RWE5_9BACL|nr:SMC family ATPase [Paenibacillus konkukensis]UQZ86986.1 Nuclease SbcCD subunit C [Paenibacillus konkukensis]